MCSSITHAKGASTTDFQYVKRGWWSYSQSKDYVQVSSCDTQGQAESEGCYLTFPLPRMYMYGDASTSSPSTNTSSPLWKTTFSRDDIIFSKLQKKEEDNREKNGGRKNARNARNARDTTTSVRKKKGDKAIHKECYVLSGIDSTAGMKKKSLRRGAGFGHSPTTMT